MDSIRPAPSPRSGSTVPGVFRASLLTLAFALFGGCSGDDKPGVEMVPAAVSGKVLLPNGSPMTAGKIIFEGEEDASSKGEGEIKSDGGFSIEKMPPGDYIVRIDDSGSSSSAPPKYKSKSTSDLTVTVKAGTNALEPFKLNNDSSKVPGTGGSSVRD